MNLPRKTTILIIILAIITGLLVFMAIKTDQTGKITNVTIPTPTTEAVKPVTAFATLYFSPSIVDFSNQATTTTTVDIVVDTQGKPISAVQAELLYDPKIISNVVVTPVSTATNNQTAIKALFSGTSQIPINIVDPVQGRISFARTIGINDQEVVGVGKIASISFSVNKFALQDSTSITFLEKSLVSTLKSLKSVLKGTTPLTVTLKNPGSIIPLAPTISSTPAVTR